MDAEDPAVVVVVLAPIWCRVLSGVLDHHVLPVREDLVHLDAERGDGLFDFTEEFADDLLPALEGLRPAADAHPPPGDVVSHRVDERLAFCAGQRFHDALRELLVLQAAIIGRARNYARHCARPRHGALLMAEPKGPNKAGVRGLQPVGAGSIPNGQCSLPGSWRCTDESGRGGGSVLMTREPKEGVSTWAW